MTKNTFKKIELYRPSPKLVNAILTHRPHLSSFQVRNMLKYNIILCSQLSVLTGKTAENIATLSNTLRRKEGNHETVLTRVIPFKKYNQHGETKDSKPVFVLLDQKCVNFILSNNAVK